MPSIIVHKVSVGKDVIIEDLTRLGASSEIVFLQKGIGLGIPDTVLCPDTFS